MHPLIRLVCFVIFSVFVSTGSFSSILLGILMLFLVWLISGQYPGKKSLTMMLRLRIFFVSIFIIYLWFTPGQLIIPAFGDYSPTVDGFFLAVERIFALLVLVLGVDTLLRMTSREGLLNGLYYLAAPFSFFGIQRNQFITRIILTMDAVGNMPKLGESSAVEKKTIAEYLQNMSTRISERFLEVATQKYEEEKITFILVEKPELTQWGYPIFVFTMFAGVLSI